MDLDDAYANGAYIENADSYPAKWEEAAQTFRTRASAVGRARLDVHYGEGVRHRFDLFLPPGEAEGLMVFIHGGYWMKFDNSYWSHLAEGARASGWAVAMPCYTLAPEARISEITQEMVRAVSEAAALVPGPLVLSGHSAGGHLVARLAEPGMLPQKVAARLRRVVPISPLGDLRPLMKTKMNETLNLDEAEAEAESPALHAAPQVPVTVWVGGDERPAFIEQAQGLAKAWSCDCVITEGEHHFNVIDPLADPESRLVKTLLGG